ncbi:protein disks lost [Drosophila ficusphila]|uniref:protein disks lost n=1 Tax=Drosophila ficusphila TaxID=30025 RepID=UPI0007E73373|nr:protein disks lost [Drosophila ficusphila]XP_017059552.1 protein disks lost [Drosophila ficusphila]
MTMSEEKHLQKLLAQLEKVPRLQLQQKFVAYFKRGGKGNNQNNCSLEEFAAYFLAALRKTTKPYFYSRSSETPVHSLTPIRQAKPPPADAPKNLEEQPHQLSDSLLNRSSCSVSSTSTTTPSRQQPQGRRSTPASGGQFCSTPNRSGGGGAGGGGNSFCLGDFLSTPNQSHQRSKKKTTPQQQQHNQHSGAITGTAAGATPQSKPRRRVLPMTISKNVSANSSFGDTSSFSNDNNLWRISQNSEIFDRSQGAALEMEARKSLLLNKQEIKSEAPVNVSQQERTPEDEVIAGECLSLEDVSDTNQLVLLSAIYGLLMDLNLVPNVLSELSFVLQLLNIRDPGQHPVESDAPSAPLERLAQYKSCVYFALKLLENQQKLLLQLDKRTLVVLLQNERLSLLPPEIVKQLEVSCQQKQETSTPFAHESSSFSQQNVYYHVEKDSRENFPTQNEFGAFKAQRDLFYKALKQWEQSHLNRMFNFASELTPRIKEIFKVSEHPVNMAHFAKLFVSQLLISGTETAESPEELGLKLDPLRHNKLAQRLVTSNSSVEGQFPRSQAFFRDFIAGCSSVAFLVHLKLALFVQLLRHNDSTFDLLQLAEDVGTEEQSAQQGPCIVRVQTMANMLILSKFLGFVTVLPFSGTTQHGSPSAPYVCPQQLQLRSHFHPNFNLREILERSMRQGKLLITLPWLVQYLVMLDLVSLHLPDSLATLELLYGLYAAIHVDKLQSGAVFITRSCIGWLLDAQPQLVNNYYNYRAHEAENGTTSAIVELCLSSLRCPEKSFAPLMDELLPVACPFLQEFRVSITPSRQARSGRFRYITTRLEQLQQSSSATAKEALAPSELSPTEQQQRKLADAFLHSQNASTRRLIEFVTERSFKCVVKDAQQEILIPSKASADAEVNEISSMKQDEVYQKLQQIFQAAKEKACQRWKEQVPQMLDRRIGQSLEALLPASTNAVLRSTYAHLIRIQAQSQLQQWLQSSVLQSTFYHGDLQELATKVCHSNRNKAEAATAAGGSSELQLSPDVGFSLSELLYQLQQWLHCLSLRPENVGSRDELTELLRRSQRAVLFPQMPTVFYHLIGSGLVHLLQLLINRKPNFLDEGVVTACCSVWHSPQFMASEAAPGIFEGLLSISFIQEMGNNPESFSLLKNLLQAMLQSGAVRADQLNELFMPLFAENWPQNVWSTLSDLLQQLSLSGMDTSGHDASGGDDHEDEAKSHLFMEMLADLSRDLDSF